MVWTGGGGYRLAPALLTLLHQLQKAYPGQQWITSPQTGTIGDTNHLLEGWTQSDHNPWLAATVRALDVAANVTGVPGIATVTDGPDCEALFAMVNRMYAARDARVWPDGYAIYRRRITDPNNPGGYWAQKGDPHLYHLHISVSTTPAGYNSTAPWPLPGESTSSGGATKIGEDMPLTEAEWARLQDMINNALLSQRAWITAGYGGVPAALSAFKPEIVGLRKNIRDTALALGGQITALPDGTPITSVGAALLSSNAHTDAALKAQPAGSTAGVDLTPIIDELQKLPDDVVAAIAQRLGSTA